jgi:hypothetical protein
VIYRRQFELIFLQCFAPQYLAQKQKGVGPEVLPLGEFHGVD